MTRKQWKENHIVTNPYGYKPEDWPEHKEPGAYTAWNNKGAAEYAALQISMQGKEMCTYPLCNGYGASVYWWVVDDVNEIPF